MPTTTNGKGSRRSVIAEHGRLRTLFGETRRALARLDESSGALEAVAELRRALATHLEKEESLYYPTIWALRPGLKQPLRALIDSHPAFRTCLDALAEALEAADFDEAQQQFESLAASFQEHERAEECVLRSLDEEIEAIP